MSAHEPHKRAAFESPGALLEPVRHDPGMKRPATITTASALVLLRVVAGALVLAGIGLRWPELIADADFLVGDREPSADDAQGALWFVIGAGAVLLAVELGVVLFVWLGRNWARVLVMLFAVGSISGSFAAWWARDEELTIRTTLLALGLDVLILLALSSRSAAAYARRNERV